MLKTLLPENCRDLLAAGEFESFLNAVESDQVEFKGEPYRLDLDLQKQELAKDVSGLANAGGGLILIGFKTTKDATVLGDFVTDLKPIPRSYFQEEKYQSIVNEWIYPTPAVTFSWFPASAENGYAVIDVLAGDQAHVPHILKRTVTEDGKRVEIVFGYLQRRQTNVQPSSVHQIHALLRSGLRMHEIGTQYNLIQDTLQRLVVNQSEASEARSVEVNVQRKVNEFKRDKQEALAAGGFQSSPNLLLAAYPCEPVQMRGLFDPDESDLIEMLRHPPRLKGNGWDLTTNQPMDNVHGRLRRGGKPGWKLLQLSREGLLLFLARGDSDFLSWSLNQKPDDPFFIVPFVLAHCLYVFTSFAHDVFTYAVPQPRKMKYVVELRNMENGGRPAMLHPNHKKQNVYPDFSFYRAMPYASEHFALEVPIETIPGEVTFELVAKIFEWFGFDRDRVPNSRTGGGKRLIDEESLFSS